MQKSQAKFLALIILSSLSSCSITPSNNTPITSQTNTGTLYVTGVPMTIATGGVQVNNNTLHSDIIFQKELAPGIEVRQTEKKTSLFYKNKVIDSRDNTLHGLEYEGLLPLTFSGSVESFSEAEKLKWAQLFGETYYKLSNIEKLPKDVYHIHHWLWEGTTDSWLIDTTLSTPIHLDHTQADLIKVERGISGLFVMYSNGGYGGIQHGFIFYKSDGTQQYIPLKNPGKADSGSLLQDIVYQYHSFELLPNKQVRVWYTDDGTQEKSNWKSYTISLL